MSSQYKFVWWLAILVLAILIANRPDNLASDYTAYEEYFVRVISGEVVDVELGYKIFSLLSEAVGFGFIGVLFIYAFIALYYKLKFFIFSRKLSVSNSLVFIFLYFVVFFPLWELTQMRNAAAIAVSCVAITSQTKNKTLVYFLFAALLHNVAIIIFLMWVVSVYFYSLRYWIVFIGSILLHFIINFMPYFSIYSADVYAQVYNPFSFKIFYIFLTFVFVLFHAEEVAKKFAFYSFAFLALYLGMRQMPAAALRIVDIALFFSVMSLVLVQGRLAMLYKLLTMVALGYVYINVAFLADPPLLNIHSLFE